MPKPNSKLPPPAPLSATLCPARVLSVALTVRAMATYQLIARAAVIRQAASDRIRGMQSHDLVLSHDDIARGFLFEGQRWPLGNGSACFGRRLLCGRGFLIAS